MSGHLKDIVVVALEQAVAVPFCTARLADAGARVIKIERSQGDFARAYDHTVHGESAYFVWLNRGKESIALDFKQPADAKLLAKMIAKADIFIQNLAPGAAARSGFCSAELRDRHPKLITCDVTGYGESGPWTNMKAYDFLIQCEAGLASITGAPEEPGRVGVSVADICCGMNAHAGLLQALYARTRTGMGSGLSVSLFDGLADWMTVPLLHQDYGGTAPLRVGMHHPTIAPYGAYRVRDDKQIVFAIQNDREWRNFCEGVICKPALETDPRFASNAKRCENRSALDTEINAVLGGIGESVLVERLQTSNIAYGSVNSVAALSNHPQLRRIEIDTPTGRVRMPAPPTRWRDDTELTIGPSPGLDEHGEALRNEFG